MVLDPVIVLVLVVIMMAVKTVLKMKKYALDKQYAALTMERYKHTLDQWENTQDLPDLVNVIGSGQLVILAHKDIDIVPPLTTEQIYKDLYERIT